MLFNHSIIWKAAVLLTPLNKCMSIFMLSYNNIVKKKKHDLKYISLDVTGHIIHLRMDQHLWTCHLPKVLCSVICTSLLVD